MNLPWKYIQAFMFAGVLVDFMEKFLLTLFELNDGVVIFYAFPLIFFDFMKNNRVHFLPFGIHFNNLFI